MIILKRLWSCFVYSLTYLIRGGTLGLFRFVSIMGDIPNIIYPGAFLPEARTDNAQSTNQLPSSPQRFTGHSDDRLEESDSDDSLICEYDSTWEEDDEHPSKKTKQKSFSKRRGWGWPDSGRNLRAAQDMQMYRRDYPGEFLEPNPYQILIKHPNLTFYRNELPSEPDQVKIEEFHKYWRGDYYKLEKVHTFIQWLFPLQEDGMNYEAYTLTKEEIQVFLADEAARARLRESYELMLDFYGVALVDKESGEVSRAEHWKERFDNLNTHTHNNLRITRILKCLGTLGFQRYQAPLVRFFLTETLQNGQLPNVLTSALDYFLFSVRDKAQRQELVREAFHMFRKQVGVSRWGHPQKFVWCPKHVQRRFLRELQRGDPESQQSSGACLATGVGRPQSTSDHSNRAPVGGHQQLIGPEARGRGSRSHDPSAGAEDTSHSLRDGDQLSFDWPQKSTASSQLDTSRATSISEGKDTKDEDSCENDKRMSEDSSLSTEEEVHRGGSAHQGVCESDDTEMECCPTGVLQSGMAVSHTAEEQAQGLTEDLEPAEDFTRLGIEKEVDTDQANRMDETPPGDKPKANPLSSLSGEPPQHDQSAQQQTHLDHGAGDVTHTHSKAASGHTVELDYTNDQDEANMSDNPAVPDDTCTSQSPTGGRCDGMSGTSDECPGGNGTPSTCSGAGLGHQVSP